MVKNCLPMLSDTGLIPGSGRAPGERNSSPLQCSYLENSMDVEPGGLQSMGLQKSQTQLINCATTTTN